MKGSLIERYGKYYAVFNVKKPDGKWSKKYIASDLEYLPKNKEKAQEFLAKQIELAKEKALEIKENPKPVLPPDPNEGKTLFVDFVKEWLRLKQKDESVDTVTKDFYESMCKNHIIPYYKDKETYLEDMDCYELQEFVDTEKHNFKGKDGNGASTTTLKRLKTVLRLIFKEARKKRIIADDPSEFIILPKQTKRLPSFFNENQIKELFEKIKDEEFYPIVYVTVLYGLRRSEALGLKWDSIDFTNKLVTIKHTVVKSKEVLEKDSTKNDSSYRVYPLSEDIENLLLQLKQKEIENRKLYGKRYNESDYIFKWSDGEMIKPDSLSRWFSNILKKNDMPHIRFHDLRHSCASLLISKGFRLKDISEWLGHADIETTANIYGHLDQERKKEIVNSLNF